MLARIIAALPGSLGLAALGALTLGRPAGSFVAFMVCIGAALIGLGLALTARDARVGMRRQLTFGAALFALHAAALYTFSTGRDAAALPATVQGIVAVLGALACAVFAARMLVVPPPAAAASGEEDPDHTLDINDSGTRTLPQSAPLQTPRRAVIAGVCGTALLVLATLYWLGDSPPNKSLGSAAATEAPPAPVSADATAPSSPLPVAPAQTPVAEESSSAGAGAGARLPTTALAPSAARRECMAQIESARLFLQFARDSADESYYALATEAQVARMLQTRPVGPRTLARIAERMWERRGLPERDAAWWASQYSRCEAARSSGSWYVVRG